MREILIGILPTVTAVLIFSAFVIPAQAQYLTEFGLLNPGDCDEKDDKIECSGGAELKDDKLEVPSAECEIKDDKDECPDDSD
jgi:hypothetical protein